MTTPSRPFALTDSVIFTGDTFVEKKALLIQDGHVLDIVSNESVPDTFERQAQPHAILVPGFIDCQVNGGDNILFNAAPTSDTVLRIAAAHKKTGTTRLLPTVVTDKKEVTRAAIEAVRTARTRDSSILGLHIEGPHISVDYRGIHDANYVRPLEPEDLRLYTPEANEIVLVTLAPEVVAPDDIRKLKEGGALISIGHSLAKREAVNAALSAGATCFTHLFNRMAPVTSREPGVAGIALDDKSSWTSIIGDNVHVASELVRMAVRAKAEDKLFFVSDAAAPAGATAPAPFQMSGLCITPRNGACWRDDGTLAGALLTLGEIVSVAIRDIRLDPEIVLRMASTIPATFLGQGHRLGKLLPGYAADVVALDHQFKAQAVWQDGVRL